jgi:hypothetical protein
MLFCACKKSDSDDPGGGGSNGCASDATICMRLGDTSYSFKGEWYGILGGGRRIYYNDSSYEFRLDVGSGDKRDFAMTTGSLWSGGARISFYKKRSNKSYNAYRGTVTITATDNSMVNGTFNGAVRNYSNAQDTMSIESGTLTAVPQQ